MFHTQKGNFEMPSNCKSGLKVGDRVVQSPQCSLGIATHWDTYWKSHGEYKGYFYITAISEHGERCSYSVTPNGPGPKINTCEFVKYEEKDYGPGPHLAADAVVVLKHYILLVTRKDGTLALPGGKVEPGETTREAGIRECLEETGFDIKNYFVNKGRNLFRNGFLFDNPKRDPRNHVVTVAHYFPCKTDADRMPVVYGKDDADEANWYSLLNLSSLENKFFADHYKIISKVIHSV